MKTKWKISIPIATAKKIPTPIGDPADVLQPAKNYALLPLPEAITNWQSILPLIHTNQWNDVTAFYSQRKTNLTKKEEKEAFNANKNAFDVAKLKGTLILYYQGKIVTDHTAQKSSNLSLPFTPNSLSFCIWHTLAEAKAGAKTTEHKKASQQVSKWYDAFAIKKFQVRVTETTEKKNIVFQKTELTHK